MSAISIATTGEKRGHLPIPRSYSMIPEAVEKLVWLRYSGLFKMIEHKMEVEMRKEESKKERERKKN